MPDRLVLLDFDGTLAWREGLWSGCAVEVLDEHLPGHGIAREAIRAGMHGRYPWNSPDRGHPELCQPERWWERMEAALARALAEAGVEGAATGRLARAVRERFLDAAVGWRLFDDTLPALEGLRRGGWRTAILSNHVPELPALVAALGLAGHVEAVLTSAAIGWEKPNPEIFAHALRSLGRPESVWMVGDNPHADVAGAEAAGIPAILVRGEGAPRSAPGLSGAVELILGAAS